jgi:uncharacterized phage protein gp47/JayE
MADFGVRAAGFTIKGLDVILSESMSRAVQMFGSTVDLTATSPLRKILEVTAAEDSELWKSMEDLYYSNFVSTAVGDNLDLLGLDLGLPRQQLFAQGTVTFKINNPQPGRQYILPLGTVVVTASSIAFYTTALLTLSASLPQADVAVQAFERGPQGNIAANQITGIDPVYQQIYINLGAGTTIQVTNAQPFTGGEQTEVDDDYRARLLGYPRNIWTLESVRSAVLGVEGVIDAFLFDPLGGADVSQSFFNLFNFNERLFSGERSLGEPYFFNIIVAHEPAWPWRTQGAVTGIYDNVSAAVDLVRPIGIHPNIIEADHIEVGVQATVIIEPGQDQQSLLASIKQSIAANIGAFKLGDNVLFSQVMRAFVEQPGVFDVQGLHLRRCPPAFGRITFGNVPFQASVIEAAVGENLVMGPMEIAFFSIDSALNDLEVIVR